jgi:predicted CXXCH cytochrome family protein
VRRIAILALLALSLSSPAAAGGAAPATIACSTCHDQPATWAKKAFVHAPVQAEGCVECHNPHASRHEKLLKSTPKRTCLSCHLDIGEKIGAGSPHDVLNTEKSCLSCHDPHASDRPKLLVDEPAKICAGCHENIAKEAGAAHGHPPAAKGDCLKCHDPHASPRPYLTQAAEPALCVSCHPVAAPKMGAAHKGISVAEAKCTGCHVPHGSASAGMIRPTAHPPFAEGSCDTCHSDPKAKPGAAAAAVPDLCVVCHEARAGGHPVAVERSCVACHTPHASSGPALIKGRERLVCLTCHTDIAAKRAGAVSYHPVFGSNQDCTTCHELHTGKTEALLKKQDALETCKTCHAQHAQFAHPMGEGVKDPSRPGKNVTCLSCHDPHGTTFRQFLLADPRQDLCVRCHGLNIK